MAALTSLADREVSSPGTRGICLDQTHACPQVEVLTEGVTREDKVLVISLATFLSLAAGLLLHYMPAQYLDFQWERATAELGWLVTSWRRKLDVHMLVNIRLAAEILAMSTSSVSVASDFSHAD